MKNWEVYIIETASGKLYTGITNDLVKRFTAHKSKRGAKFFRTSKPQKIVYREKCRNRSHASSRESQIKKLPRSLKLALISQF